MPHIEPAAPATDAQMASALLHVAERIHQAEARERRAGEEAAQAAADLVAAQKDAARLIVAIDFGRGFTRILQQEAT